MNDMTQGYVDGIGDSRIDLPENSNYSAQYIHGWYNGRDDRMRKPRASYAELKLKADKLMGEAAYL